MTDPVDGDRALSELSPAFWGMYAAAGRPSIPPEKLLRVLLLQIFYSIRSERLLCEQLDYNLLFRWFIGLSMDDPVQDHSTFSENRDRLLESDIVRGFLAGMVAQAEAEGLTSDELFTVDDTLIEAWTSLKSVRRKDGSDEHVLSGIALMSRVLRGSRFFEINVYGVTLM